MDKNRLKKELSSTLKGIPSVLSIYLFGSVAAGIERESSDLDIAAYLDEETAPEQMMELRFHLMDIFSRFCDRDVDIVI